jgi:hypothetical protein
MKAEHSLGVATELLEHSTVILDQSRELPGLKDEKSESEENTPLEPLPK